MGGWEAGVEGDGGRVVAGVMGSVCACACCWKYHLLRPGCTFHCIARSVKLRRSCFVMDQETKEMIKEHG